MILGEVNMFKSAYYLLEILNSLGVIEGRKKLQKMIHLIETSGVNLPFKYEYHFYGPYSAQLQEEVNFLVNQGFLEEFKENETYIYRITQRGKEFKNKLEESYSFSFDFDEKLLTSLNEKSSQFLEMVSTYAFLLDSGYDTKSAKLKAIELKPHLKHIVNDAINYFHQQVGFSN